MNKDKWNALPKDIQNIIEKVNKEWIDKHAKTWDDIDKEGLEFFLENGGEIINIDAEETKRWVTAIQPVFDNYITETANKGLNGQEIIDFVKSRF